ncbi:MAG: acetyl-CoA carboxylase carboxyltransferase subunit alpha [bacterium]|nr:acetyl-CoA carboxylase carboxyltransferase subunit alpha [bacterium]
MRYLEFESDLEKIDKKIEEEKALGNDVSYLIKEAEKISKKIYSSLKPYERVLLARHPDRPYTLDYINMIFEGFIELHGDRAYKDDASIVGGIAYLKDIEKTYSVVVVGHQKGRNTEEAMIRNFGMPHPEGYRKAKRLFKLAERFSKPIITFIDTPGAYPGIGAEERGQAYQIAENIIEMTGTKTPIISVVIGEGGSGGAIAIGVADRLLILKNAYYSVISPEGCAAILYEDASKADLAAKALKILPEDLYELEVVDEIIEESMGAAHRDPQGTAENLKKAILKHLNELIKIDSNTLLKNRFEKYQKIGALKQKKGGRYEISKSRKR